jgi:uncharacterized membrane protein (DUF2068 family)
MLRAWLAAEKIEMSRRTEPPNAVIKAAVVYKGISSVLLLLAALILFDLVTNNRVAESIRTILIATAIGTKHVLLERLFIRLGMVTRIGAFGLGLVALAYSVLEGAESAGLALRHRWAEYLTFLATILLLPLEVFELTERFTFVKCIVLILNIALAVYLFIAKRLFQMPKGLRSAELAGLAPEIP